MNAPLALFVYNRVDHTRQVLESLKTNLLSDETDLFIFSDAPRKGSEDKVKEVRKLIREKQWCKNVHITENTANKGVDDNIVENVTELINRFGKVIIIEDDCVLSKYFLKYMNNALDFYANEERVMHISAYCHPSEVILPSTYFSQDSNGWGWATWKRAWQHYEKDPVKLYNILEKENLFYNFNYEGKLPDFQAQLLAGKEGRMKNWDIKWYSTIFLRGALVLKFSPSLVLNIGHDGSGEHCNDTNDFEVTLANKFEEIKPIPMRENTLHRNSYINVQFRNSLKLSGRIKHIFIKKILGF